MPRITEASSLTDVCFAICTALQRAGTIAVLTGGSAATYYAPEAYQSGDADFVITFQSDPAGAGAAVRSLGYRDMGGTYRHDRNVFTLEFPPGPLAVGDDLIRSYETVTRGQEILYVLSRTDCVRDRLASFYFFADRSALAAAVAVAARPVDLALIERWSDREGHASRFAEFLGYLQ
ncbi:MAG TPA: hypothetical protein VMT95_11915 [Candidatus Binatia bacterium]|nr:hypothetical protein [Candidatus Binatia bacterium]